MVALVIADEEVDVVEDEVSMRSLLTEGSSLSERHANSIQVASVIVVVEAAAVVASVIVEEEVAAVVASVIADEAEVEREVVAEAIVVAEAAVVGALVQRVDRNRSSYVEATDYRVSTLTRSHRNHTDIQACSLQEERKTCWSQGTLLLESRFTVKSA